MKFDAWRVANGPLKTEPLHIRRKVTDEELKNIQNIIKAETIVKINDRIADKSIFARSDALFEEFIKFVSSDNELNEYLEKLRKPVTYVDSILGTFTFDRQVNWYKGNIIWVE